MKTYIVRFDGGARGNPGPGGCGAVLMCPDGLVKNEASVYLGTRVTNNEAEYNGLIVGLKMALAHSVRHVRVEGDSELIIKQMNGVYGVRAPNLIPLKEKAAVLSKRFEFIEFIHIPRALNSVADGLSNKAMNEMKTRLPVVLDTGGINFDKTSAEMGGRDDDDVDGSDGGKRNSKRINDVASESFSGMTDISGVKKQSSSCSPTRAPIKKVRTEDKVCRCMCGKPAVRRCVKKEGENKGRFFFACASGRPSACKYFEWEEDITAGGGGGSGDDGVSGINMGDDSHSGDGKRGYSEWAEELERKIAGAKRKRVKEEQQSPSSQLATVHGNELERMPTLRKKKCEKGDRPSSEKEELGMGAGESVTVFGRGITEKEKELFCGIYVNLQKDCGGVRFSYPYSAERNAVLKKRIYGLKWLKEAKQWFCPREGMPAMAAFFESANIPFPS